MFHIKNDMDSSTCCLCLSQDETTFHSNSVMKSRPLHELVHFCIGIQMNVENQSDHVVSTSICNECVLNINNFYTFKKRVLEAQELINSLTPLSNEHKNNESDDEYLEEDQTNKNAEQHHNDDEGEEEEEFELEHVEVCETEVPVQFDDVSPNDKNHVENNEEQHNHDDAQMGSVHNQDTTQQSIRIVRLEISKKRSNNSKAAILPPSPSPPSPPPHKKTKLPTELPSKRFTLQINECLICPAILSDILQLKEHIESHANAGQIKCKVCHRQFVRYSNLKRHFNSFHSKPKPFTCDICGLGFNFSLNLQSHAALHYSGKIPHET